MTYYHLIHLAAYHCDRACVGQEDVWTLHVCHVKKIRKDCQGRPLANVLGKLRYNQVKYKPKAVYHWRCSKLFLPDRTMTTADRFKDIGISAF